MSSFQQSEAARYEREGYGGRSVTRAQAQAKASSQGKKAPAGGLLGMLKKKLG